MNARDDHLDKKRIGRRIVARGRNIGIPDVFLFYLSKVIKILFRPRQFLVRRMSVPALTNELKPEMIKQMRSSGVHNVEFVEQRKIDAAIAAAKSVYADRSPAITAEVQIAAGKKVFLIDLLKRKDLEAHSEFLKLALDENILSFVANYLGTAPCLRSLTLWWSLPATGKALSSQLYHRDQVDVEQVKFFLLVDSVTRDDGPLCILPADITKEVSRKLHMKRYDRYTDEQIYEHCDPTSVIEAVGNRGAMFAVDTSRCFHYGSRSPKKERLVIMFNFTSAFNAMEEKNILDVEPEWLGEQPSSLQRMAIT